MSAERSGLSSTPRARKLGLDLHLLGAQPVLEVRREEVAHADAEARDLVLVGGADPARGRTDLAGPARLFAGAVELGVAGHQDMGTVGEEEPAVGADAGLVEAAQLSQEGVRRDHHPVAEDAEHPLVEDARGDQVE